jgi:threonine dehydratase
MNPPGLPVSAADVADAAARLREPVPPTPAARSATLSAITGADVAVKFENLQFTGSFKERGARNRLALLDADERARGVLAVSAGNHARALAHHAQLMGIGCTVVMPATTPWAKVEPIRLSGATVVLEGETFHDTLVTGERLAADSGYVVVPPFDDPAVIAGQGTAALELLDAFPDLDTIVVPVGGGGLIAGIAIAAKDRRRDIDIVGVQSELFPAFARDHSPAVPPGAHITIAEGIAVKEPGVITRRIVDALVDDVVVVPEARIEEAIALYLEIEKVVAEGAGAAGLAALLHDPARFAGRRVGLVLSGGNIDQSLLAQVIMRALARSGRIARLTVRLADRPGTLARVATVVGEHGANIISVNHDRSRLELALKAAELDLTIEVRDAAHRAEVVAALEQAGFAVLVAEV